MLLPTMLPNATSDWPRRGHGGHQFQQRGADRDHRQTDHPIGDPGRGRQLDRRADQQLRAGQRQTQTSQGQQAGQPRRGRRSPDRRRLVRVHARAGVVRAALALIGEDDVGDQQGDQGAAGRAPELPGQHHRHGGERRRGHHSTVAQERSPRGDQRPHDGGQPQDQQDVRDVAADHVADRDPGRPDQRGLHASHQLRGRRAEAHQGKPDQQRRDAETPGQRDRAAHQRLAAGDQKQQTDQEFEEQHGVPSPVFDDGCQTRGAPVAGPTMRPTAAMLLMLLDLLIAAFAIASALLWWAASRQRMRRISRQEVLDAADINRMVTILNRAQILNARAAFTTSCAGMLAAARILLDLVGAVS
jgi:hypothetical protein